MQPTLIESPHLVEPGKQIDLAAAPTSADGLGLSKEEAKALAAKHIKRIDKLQEVLFAEGKHAVLIVLQAIDTGGKDSTIRNVFEPLDPQGVSVASFRAPTPLELSHDYLWRYHMACPTRGHITLFNRSHYESVLVERVKKIVPEKVWRRRYEEINTFERMLASEGTTILKFFLHISKQEQAQRFRDRLLEPEKWWKFNEADLEERRRWDEYQAAFQDAMNECSTPWAPWYAIPADQKWYRNLQVAEIVRKKLESLDLRYPEPEPGLEDKISGFLKALDAK
jgi:PPK2 family polyphosphate:nucleotide phosphotransferase